MSTNLPYSAWSRVFLYEWGMNLSVQSVTYHSDTYSPLWLAWTPSNSVVMLLCLLRGSGVYPCKLCTFTKISLIPRPSHEIVFHCWKVGGSGNKAILNMEAHKRLYTRLYKMLNNTTQYLGHSVRGYMRFRCYKNLLLYYGMHCITSRLTNRDQITHDIVGNDVIYS